MYEENMNVDEYLPKWVKNQKGSKSSLARQKGASN